MDRCTGVILLALALLAVCAQCKWVRLDPCDERSRPDGSDIVWPVEVDDSNGTLRYRYPLGPPPFGTDLTNSSGNSSERVSEKSRSKRAATRYWRALWPGGIVNYRISSSFSDNEKQIILDGLRHWEDKTCIRFRERRPQDFYYVFIISGSCCCSSIGRVYGGQRLSLERPWCVRFSTVVHEIGHVVGFWHEHNRPDRDEHVNMYTDNIQPGNEHNFRILHSNRVQSLGTPYDAVSIMHYREYAFSVNRRKTLESKHSIPLGGPELSPTDVKQARLLYKCPADPSNDPPKMVPPRPDVVVKMPTEVNPNCSHYIRASSGTFSSPNYPNHYRDNVTCGWIIQAPPGYNLRLSFSEISLDSRPFCSDVLMVYRGVATFNRRVCRSLGAFEITLGNRIATVIFTTDAIQGIGTGFRVNFSSYDYDECRGYGSRLCRYRCRNTQGSYTCDCPSGLYSPETRKYLCLDTNECLDNNGGCSHQCINTYRSYKCTCPSGMTLRADRRTCESDACAAASCQHSCTRSGASHRCSCNQGYRLNSDQRTCNDINECQSNHGCAHICVNTPGSFRCECRRGFLLNGDAKTCRDLDECTGSHRCQHNCHNTVGSYSCSCRTGYQQVGATNCRDIDECTGGTSGCNHTCRNVPGSFVCSCQRGYSLLDDSKSCADIDECAVPQLNRCQQLCVNTNGDYSCTCKDGYEVTRKIYCTNINECESDNGGCDGVCRDSDGSYTCSCTRGLMLSQDRHTCISPDPDCEPGTHGCQSICNGDLCTCQSDANYRLSRSGRHCVDIDECSENISMCSSVCKNTLGSYQCSCPRNLSLALDLHNCVERSCDLRNGECSQNCFYSVRGLLLCSCNRGFVLDNDARQCKAKEDVFTGAVGTACALPCEHVCNTSSADHICQCYQGFRLLHDGVSCEEIDECAENSSGCSHGCLNTNGSYVCLCPLGYQLMPNKHTCIDTNECLGDHGCAWQCNNTVGSYHCLCPVGFAVIPDGRNCGDIDECSQGTAGCSHICTNTNGSFQCSCPPGRISLSDDQRTCIDYDECADASINHCEEICLNNDGSFVCACSGERILAWDGFHCQDVCSGVITAPASITLPSYTNGSGFLPRIECEWSINASESNVVVASLSHLNELHVRGESTEGTCESYFEIRNGPSANSTMLKKHCLGSNVSGPVVSSTPAMHIKWHSGSLAGLTKLTSSIPLPVTVQPPNKEGVWTCGRSIVRPGMDFGPANFPAVIDSPMKCTWFVLGPAGKMAIEFLYADLANSNCESPTGNCIAVLQTSWRDDIHSSSQIQRISVDRSSAIVYMFIYDVPPGFRGFHARVIMTEE